MVRGPGSDRRAPPPGPRAARGRAALVAASAYAAVTAVVLLGWRVAGDVWWLQPLHLSTFWWTLPALVLLGVAVVRGRWTVAALVALPAVVFVWSYGGAFLPQPAAATVADLRVATYNTWVGAPDVRHVTALVEREDPDVLLLQEVLPERFHELEDALSGRLPHRWAASGDETVGGVAVFSRYPVTRVVEVDAGPNSRRAGVLVLDVDGRPLQVVPLHLVSPCPGCGASLPDRLTFEASTRRAEVDTVLARVDPSVPVIVGGDLNSTDRSDAYRALVDAGFDDPHRSVGSGPGFTWPGGATPLMRVDWILTRGMEPVREWVTSDDGSDHRPVLVDVAFPG